MKLSRMIFLLLAFVTSIHALSLPASLHDLYKRKGGGAGTAEAVVAVDVAAAAAVEGAQVHPREALVVVGAAAASSHPTLVDGPRAARA